MAFRIAVSVQRGFWRDRREGVGIDCGAGVSMPNHSHARMRELEPTGKVGPSVPPKTVWLVIWEVSLDRAQASVRASTLLIVIVNGFVTVL